MPTQKLFCYVDETGQDTKGRLFIVAVVVTAEKRDELLALCEQLEADSAKGRSKWSRTQHPKRLAYLRRVLTDRRFHAAIRYAVFRHTTGYDLATIEAVAKALHQQPTPYAATVYVDGLPPSKRNPYTQHLRGLGLSIEKVRGVPRDENNALIRLADAVAGFVRDVEESRSAEYQELFTTARQRGLLIELP
jgi:hypothetical protein